MLKPHHAPARSVSRFRSLRPFPLYRLPSLLKRSLSISSSSSSSAPRSRKSADEATFSSSFASSSSRLEHGRILLQILPSVKNSRFATVILRLLCQSLSYIAGISFYDFVASLLSLSHDQMRVYDVLSSSSAAAHRAHSSRKLMDAWLVTIVLGVFVTITVYAVVKLGEKKFAFQIHKEIEQIEMIEAQMLQREDEFQRNKEVEKKGMREKAEAEEEATERRNCGTNGTTASSSSSHAPKRVSLSLPEGVVAEDDDEDEEEEEKESLVEQSEREARQREQISLLHRNPALAAKIKAEEDKRAVTRALIHTSSVDEQEDEEEEEQEEEEEDEKEEEYNALHRAVEAGLTPRQIARQADRNQERRKRREQKNGDPIKTLSPSILFLYRFIDLFAFYAVFIAMYAFQNTLQLTFSADTLQFSWLYLIMLAAVSFTIVRFLEIHSDDLHHRLVVKQAEELKEKREQEQRLLKFSLAAESAELDASSCSPSFASSSSSSSPPSATEGISSSRPVSSVTFTSSLSSSARSLKALRVQQATHRKLSSYVCSCLAYLLAYAAWNTMQATSLALIPDGYEAVLTSRLYLWCSALSVMAASGLILVCFNWRIRLALIGESEAAVSNLLQPLDWSSRMLRALCCYSLFSRFISREPASTEKLAAHLDNVMEGSVTSFLQQTSSEALSYIIALSLGAALTSCLTAAPSDAAIYTGKKQPSASALISYALACSLTLAMCTLWLERYVKRQELRCRQRTQRLLDAHSRAVLEQQQRPSEAASFSSPSSLPAAAPNSVASSQQRPSSRHGALVLDMPGVQCTPSSDGHRMSYRVDTPETALYVLYKQQNAEQALRDASSEEEYARREERRRQKNALHLLMSPPQRGTSDLETDSTKYAGAGFLALPSSSDHSPLPVASSSSPTSYGSFTSDSSASAEPSHHQHHYSLDDIHAATQLLATHASAPNSPPSQSSSDHSSTHRAILALSFLEQYYAALASTLTQGFALLVAYSWVGVFSLCLYPALRRWSILWLVDDFEIRGAWSACTFIIYFVFIFCSARYFHRAEFLEL